MIRRSCPSKDKFCKFRIQWVRDPDRRGPASRSFPSIQMVQQFYLCLTALSRVVGLQLRLFKTPSQQYTHPILIIPALLSKIKEKEGKRRKEEKEGKGEKGKNKRIKKIK